MIVLGVDDQSTVGNNRFALARFEVGHFFSSICPDPMIKIHLWIPTVVGRLSDDNLIEWRFASIASYHF